MGKLFSPQGGWRVWMRRAMGAGVLLLASCGGGSDGSGGAPDSQAGVGSGGTGSYSNGPITDFGSIVVNGVHYDHLSAKSITKVGGNEKEENTQHAPSELQKGMTVEVDVAAPADGGGLIIRFGSDLLGKVSEVNTDVDVSTRLVKASGTVTVMGHKVYVDDSTHLGDGLTSLSDIRVNDVVEVYGYGDPLSNAYLATRIERKSAAYAGRYVVRGVVKNLLVDADQIQCDIGGQHMVYPRDSSTPLVAEGAVARAEVYQIGEDWLASRIKMVAPLVKVDRSDAAVTGPVTSVDAIPTHFSVNGIPVDTSLMGSCLNCVAMPPLGKPVMVKGSYVNGVIVATEVKTTLP
jgi:hypothetical protein